MRLAITDTEAPVWRVVVRPPPPPPPPHGITSSQKHPFQLFAFLLCYWPPPRILCFHSYLLVFRLWNHLLISCQERARVGSHLCASLSHMPTLPGSAQLRLCITPHAAVTLSTGDVNSIMTCQPYWELSCLKPIESIQLPSHQFEEETIPITQPNGRFIGHCPNALLPWGKVYKYKKINM